jgi:Phage tail lysozyme/Peptidase M15
MALSLRDYLLDDRGTLKRQPGGVQVASIMDAHRMLDTPVSALVKQYAPERAGSVPGFVGNQSLRNILQNPMYGGMVLQQLQPMLGPQLQQWGVTQQDFVKAINEPPPNPPPVIKAQPVAAPAPITAPSAVQSAAAPRPPGNVPTGIPAGLNPKTQAYAQKLMKDVPGTAITSGHRDVATNAKVGGAKGSQHIGGNALDISLKGLTDQQKGAIIDHALANGARGIGYYPGSDSAHIDFRGGANAAWGPNYSRTSLGETPGWFRQRALAHLRGDAPGSVVTPTAAAPTLGASGAAARARGAAISPDFVMNKLQSLGFNEAQSRALIGNMTAESSLRPSNVNTKEGAYGLIQWRGERFNQLNQYAQQKGTSWRDPNTQLEFLAHEMRYDPYESRQSRAFLAATTVEDANRGLRSYIRYGDNSEGKRLAYAQAVPQTAGGVASSAVAQAPAVQAIQAAVRDPAPATAAAPGFPQSVMSLVRPDMQNASFPAVQPPQSAPAARPAQAPITEASSQARAPARLQGRSALAQGIIAGYGPAGANLSTFVEPATGNEIISGSIGGDSYWKNLGRTGAGQPIVDRPPKAQPASLKQAVEQATAAPPLPRPRPPEAPRDLGQRFRPVIEAPEPTHPGVMTAPPGSQNVTLPDQSWRLGGQAPQHQQSPNVPAPTGQLPFQSATPLPGATFPGPQASPRPYSPAPSLSPNDVGGALRLSLPELPPLAQSAPSIPGVSGPGASFPGPTGVVPPAQAAPAFQPQAQVPFLQWWQQPGGLGGYAGGGFGMPGFGGMGAGGGGFPLFGGFGSGGGGVG